MNNKEEAENIIKDFKEQNKDATHNCYAYTCGTNINYDLFGNLEITPDYFRQNDDGEPANTAGKPILAQIQ
ncbi:MAG: IMPACT family member YigZ [candidate division CPR1 bacterium ADurb.Bin160]|uniref:IMPACT family member YigZ n=1 Tax=candidate division CPR1 bacterium ADurb.Bin160 TaxID=1852826 RepID=A0A1V5ZPM5_9BACT|nr:MAG: IMPACT family member YigZ [candidate division CPR1 bacterium ADurb.Bin160]